MSAGYGATREQEQERRRVLDAIRDCEKLTLKQLDDMRAPGFTATALRWHLLILGDRGLVEWSGEGDQRVVSVVER